MTNYFNSTFKIKEGAKPLKRTPFKARRTPLKGSITRVKPKPTVSKLKKQLWAITREIIILKYGSDCYTCPARNLSGSNRQCGHYISSSICSAEIRYSLDNLRIQCSACNIWRSGNWLAFESHLIKDGIDVAALKQRNYDTKGMKADSLFYINKIAEYSTLLAELQQ